MNLTRWTLAGGLALALMGCDGDAEDEAGSADTAAEGMDDDAMDDGMEETAAEQTLDEDMILSAAMAYATDLQQVSAEPRTSQHAIANMVQFYVSPADAETYLGIDPDGESTASFDEGALFVKENLDADGNPDGFFAMYKAYEGYDPEGNDWYYLRVTAAGNADNAGKVGFCRDCHAGASDTDYAFGVPLDNRL